MKLLAFLLMTVMVAGSGWAQTMNGVGPASSIPDGSSTGYTTYYQMPQVQSTPGMTPTPQVSAWLNANGSQAVQVDFNANTLTGFYGVQVSNNPTPQPYSTPTIYNITEDHPTWASGGQGAQTTKWSYMIGGGWRFFRFFCTPDSTNGGQLNIGYRVFKNESYGSNLVNLHTYHDGVPNLNVFRVTTQSAEAAGTTYDDYKKPSEFNTFALNVNISALSASTTLTTTLEGKDPYTGVLYPVAPVPVTFTAAGQYSILVGPGLAGTAPTGTTYASISAPTHLVVKNVVGGSGTASYTVEAEAFK